MSDELLGCPFCGKRLSRTFIDLQEFWMHPGTVTDRDCVLAGKGFYPRELPAWNRRSSELWPVADADPWSDANMLRSIAREVGRWPSNCISDGAPSSADTLREIADRLQSVAAATAAKDAEIARPREALSQVAEGRNGSRGESLPHDAHSSQRIARAALSEAREAGELDF